MAKMLLALILFSLSVTCVADTNQGRAMAMYISSNANVNCMWVDKVGDSVPSANVNFKEMAITCIQQENNETFNGTCEGTLRCTGVEGWGDIYFENLSCPGKVVYGKAVCGRQQTTGTFATGIKSCIHYFLENPPIVSANGNHVIQSSPRSFETDSEVNR